MTDSMNHIPEEFLPAVRDLGIEFDDGDLNQLAMFLDSMFRTNQLFNLTAIKDPEQAWMRHILDSLSLIPHLAKEGAMHIVDVGSGGGLPGIPLAITMPQCTFSLVESTNKKAMFLAAVAEELGLENVTVLAERAENLSTRDGGFRDIADAVIARAVGPLNVLLELTIPFVKVDGLLLTIKGKKAPEEIETARQALHVLQATVESIQQTTTGTILCIRKHAATPKKYPRSCGEPKRAPIGKGRRP